MPNQFDALESESLKFYVYLYSDPQNSQPFYIGKGVGNRAFSHLSDASESGKVARIREIREAGREPTIEILAFGLDETTAFKVEAAAIDLVGFENLTNQVVGHGARKFGRMTVDEVHGKLSSIPIESFAEHCVLIRINDTFADAAKHGPIDLYDATRGTWRIGLDRASQVKFALAVFGGIVREVYEIAQWFPAASTMYADPARAEEPSGRYEFVGRVASAEVGARYRWKSVAHLYSRGAANPIMYVGPRGEELPVPEVPSVPSGLPAAPTDDVVIVAARSAYPEYLALGAYICQPDRVFRESATRLGFYADGEIKTEIAEIQYVEESVIFTLEEAERRKASAHPEIRRVGELLEVSISNGRGPGHAYKVMLLSPKDAAETILLQVPILNDQTTVTGKRWGWTLGQRYISLAALMSGPAVTSALETAGEES